MYYVIETAADDIRQEISASFDAAIAVAEAFVHELDVDRLEGYAMIHQHHEDGAVVYVYGAFSAAVEAMVDG